MNTLIDQQAVQGGLYRAVTGTTVDTGEIQSLFRELFTSGCDQMSATARKPACSPTN